MANNNSSSNNGSGSTSFVSSNMSKEDTMNNNNSVSSMISSIIGKFSVPVITMADREEAPAPRQAVSAYERFSQKNSASVFSDKLEDLRKLYLIGDLPNGQIYCAPDSYKNVRDAMGELGEDYDRALKFYRVSNHPYPAAVWKVIHAASIAAAVIRIFRGLQITAYGNDNTKGYADIWQRFPGLTIPRNAREAWVHQIGDGQPHLEYVTDLGIKAMRPIMEKEYFYDDGTSVKGGSLKLGRPVKTRLVAAAQRHNRAQLWSKRQGHIDVVRGVALRKDLTVEEEIAAINYEQINGDIVQLVDTEELSRLIQHPFFEIERALSRNRAVIVTTGEWFLDTLQIEVWKQIIHNAGFGWGVSEKAAKMCFDGEDYMVYLDVMEPTPQNDADDADDSLEVVSE